MPRPVHLAILLLAFALSASGASAQLVDGRQILTLEGAKEIAFAAQETAEKMDKDVVIVITDASGELLLLHRMEGVQFGSLEIAHRKARTAARYRRPTKVFADQLANGRDVILDLPDMIALEGGLNIMVDGRTIGAIGVSGASGAEDAQIGRAGIDALLANLEQ